MVATSQSWLDIIWRTSTRSSAAQSSSIRAHRPSRFFTRARSMIAISPGGALGQSARSGTGSSWTMATIKAIGLWAPKGRRPLKAS
jgi:hypothetical protein